MEDAHAAVLDLHAKYSAAQDGKPTDPDKRLAFFGVYDGHGGDKVALFAGENLHKIVAQQDSFAQGDIEQALKDGFLATDRAILEGSWSTLEMSGRSIPPPPDYVMLAQTRNTKRKCPAVPRQQALSRSTRSGWYVLSGRLE